jgi:hypothetical protein
LQIQQNFSTPRHQQANGQAEIQVRLVKKVLRKYVDYKAENWSEVLPLVEFALNNSANTSTGYSPFYLFFGFEPRVFPEEYLTLRKADKKNLMATIGQALATAKERIAASQADMMVRFNRHRKEAPAIPTGSSVWVKADGISWPAGSKRPAPLADSMLGPFAVTKGNLDQFPELGLNVELELPPSLAQVHPVFHVEKIEPFIGSSKDQFPGRSQQAPAPVVQKDGTLVAEVETILDHRYHNRQLQYLVKFVGYPRSEAEWHTFVADDPAWDDDVALVVSFQEKHGLPQWPMKSVGSRVPSPPTVPACAVHPDHPIMPAIGPPASSLPLVETPAPTLVPPRRTARAAQPRIRNPLMKS